jgi:hypothetical protein
MGGYVFRQTALENSTTKMRKARHDEVLAHFHSKRLSPPPQPTPSDKWKE